jgi:hypothetical protein
MDRCDSEEIELEAVLTFKIWLRRNSIVYGGFFYFFCSIIQESKGECGGVSQV